MTLLERIFERIERVPAGWKDEAEKRYRISKSDGGADTMSFCAAELLEEIRLIKQENYWLNPAEYLDATGLTVTVQTIRNWAHRGELEGAVIKDNGEILIPATARHKKTA